MTVSPRGVGAALLVLLVAGVCVRLGFWQLDRLEQRRERNDRIGEALAQPVIDLAAGRVGDFERHPLSYLNRRVRVRGSYDPEQEVVLRGRARQGQPGVHLVTPLRLSGSDAAVLVNRGWVPAADAATVDPAPLVERGTHEIRGLVQRMPGPELEAFPSPISTPGGEVLTLQRLDLSLLRGRAPYPLLPVYIQQLPDTSLREPPFRIPIAELGEGPHLGYALQWFSFAAIAVIGFVVVVIRKAGARSEEVRR